MGREKRVGGCLAEATDVPSLPARGTRWMLLRQVFCPTFHIGVQLQKWTSLERAFRVAWLSTMR